jgi:F-type H+-transporting ATPase subunit b
MKRFNSIAWFFLLVAVGIFGFGSEVSAVESQQGWRATYDMILKWINFGILVFLIVKFTRTPLKNFLLSQKENIIQQLKRREEEKEAASKRINEVIEKLKESEARMEAMKNRLIEQGQKRKQQIIDDAKDQSRQIIEDAKRRVGSQILQAKQQLKSELVDSAVALATKRLPKEITQEDAQKFVDCFIAGTVTK